MNRSTVLFALALSVVTGSIPALAVGTQPDVLRKIHLINQLEIKAGKLAEEKGNTKQVRDYGHRLVTDHTQADQAVQKAANDENIDVNKPIAQVDEKIHADETDLMNKLQAANGVAFDQAFAQAMDSAHHDAIHSLKEAEDQYKGTETAKLIAEILPKLEKHERIAEKIEKRGE